MGFFSRLFDALKSLFGGRRETPHESYYRGWEGYWYPNTVTLRAAGLGFDSALSRVCAELNRGAKEAGLPYTFATTNAPGENVLVAWDTTGTKVSKGNTGRTPPEEMVGHRPDMPWAQKHCCIYVKPGTSGESLYTLLLHEAFTHGGKLEHSDEERDVAHPKANVGRLSAADIATWKLASQRRKRDGLEPTL